MLTHYDVKNAATNVAVFIFFHSISSTRFHRACDPISHIFK